MAKRKQKTIAGLLDQAAVLLQKIRRIESADENGYCTCSSCGKKVHWKECDGGHWISRTKTATKIEPTNINPQCKGCNSPLQRHIAGPWYDKWMRETYGDEHCNMLLELSKQTIKRNRADLMEIISEYKNKLADIV